MGYEIIRNDIAKVEADAIVNTANPRPQIGAGTDTAIHRAAGPELLEARKKIGSIAPGEVAVTPAFRLNAKYVIHAVSPAWQGGKAHEEELLRRTYDNALQAALDHGCKSVAFPLLAAGTYGFPGEKAMSIALSAFTEFLMQHEIRIILVVFNRSVFQLAGHLFDGLRSYVDETYVAEARASEYGIYGNQGRYDELEEIYRRDRRRRNRIEEDMVCGAPMQAPCAPQTEDDQDVPAGLRHLIADAEQSFHHALFRIIDEKGLKDSAVYDKALISKQMFSKIRCNPKYQPTKSVALRLAVVLKLDYDEAMEFLGYAGYTLSRSNYTDIVIEYFLKTRDYDTEKIDTALFGYHQPTLFSIL